MPTRLDNQSANAAILFDKDGTLFDFRATWCVWVNDFLSRLSGVDRDRAVVLGDLIGFDVHSQQFAKDSIVIAGTPAEIAAALLSGLPGWTFDRLLSVINRDAAEAPLVEAVPLRPLLGRLRAAGYVLGVATNDAEAAAEAHLDRAGVRDLFDIVYGSDSGVGAKPGPASCWPSPRRRDATRAGWSWWATAPMTWRRRGRRECRRSRC